MCGGYFFTFLHLEDLLRKSRLVVGLGEKERGQGSEDFSPTVPIKGPFLFSLFPSFSFHQIIGDNTAQLVGNQTENDNNPLILFFFNLLLSHLKGGLYFISLPILVDTSEL